MKPRDLAIVAAVLVLGGIAAADALRDGGDGEAAQTPTATVAAPRPVELERVPAQGRIVWTDEDCRLHEAHVATAQELPLPPAPAGCELWSAARGERIAQSLPRGTDSTPFRLIDLDHPFRRLGTYASDGGVVFSPDGLAAAWCLDGTGFRLELGDEAPERLPACPVALTPAHEPAYPDAGGLRVGERLYPSSSIVTFAAWAEDGSAVFATGERLERRRGLRVTHAVPLPEELAGRVPVVSPNGCVALFPLGGQRIRVVDLCGEADLGETPGTDAAFSPDGTWVAVLGDRGITFVSVPSGRIAARWTVRARQIAWLG